MIIIITRNSLNLCIFYLGLFKLCDWVGSGWSEAAYIQKKEHFFHWNSHCVLINVNWRHVTRSLVCLLISLRPFWNSSSLKHYQEQELPFSSCPCQIKRELWYKSDTNFFLIQVVQLVFSACLMTACLFARFCGGLTQFAVESYKEMSI